jgi:DNA-binding CsgD family transcriptional regulator
MSGRGRPPTPDILTPREWQVLELLRHGLSNREIADELGISLAGAKFHVSEIISKLGVTSREEAVAWQEEARSGRPGFVPGFVYATLRRLIPRSLALKLAASAALMLVLGGIGVSLAVLARSSSSDAGDAGAASVSPAPLVCNSGATCFDTPVQKSPPLGSRAAAESPTTPEVGQDRIKPAWAHGQLRGH